MSLNLLTAVAEFNRSPGAIFVYKGPNSYTIIKRSLSLKYIIYLICSVFGSMGTNKSFIARNLEALKIPNNTIQLSLCGSREDDLTKISNALETLGFPQGDTSGDEDLFSSMD